MPAGVMVTDSGFGCIAANAWGDARIAQSFINSLRCKFKVR